MHEKMVALRSRQVIKDADGMLIWVNRIRGSKEGHGD